MPKFVPGRKPGGPEFTWRLTKSVKLPAVLPRMSSAVTTTVKLLGGPDWTGAVGKTVNFSWLAVTTKGPLVPDRPLTVSLTAKV